MHKEHVILLIIVILIGMGVAHKYHKHSDENVLKSWHEFDIKKESENTRIDFYRDIKRMTKNLTASQVHEMLGNDNFDIYVKYRENLADIYIKYLDGKEYNNNKYIYYLGREFKGLYLYYDYFLIVNYKDKDDPIFGVQLLKLDGKR